MTGIDKTQRKLIFPPRFVPYLEKHRIFELFHELAELLIQERPKDHIKFLKDVLPCAAKRRDKPRIVFLAPQSFDREKFAKEVARNLQISCYTRKYLEMKERERKLLEWLKKQEAMKQPSIEEDLSCICPGESYLSKYEFPAAPPEFYEEETFVSSMLTSLSTSAEEEVEKVKEIQKEEKVKKMEKIKKAKEENELVAEDMDPCKGMRVCPCKRKDDIIEVVTIKPQEENEKIAVETTELQDEESNEGSRKESITEKTSSTLGTDMMAPGDVKSSTTKKTKDTTKTEPSSTTETSCVCESEEIGIDFGILGKCEYSENGWILIDFPENAEEALHIAEKGVIPTHAIRIVTGGDDEKTRKYKYLYTEWEAVYKSIPVLELHLNGRDTIQFAQDVSKLLKVMPHRHAPMLPRIVLIGSRGSGATTQAALLAKKYKMVHIQYQEEMARMVLKNDKFSEAYKRQLQTRPDPELEALLLERILMAPRCCRRGWVLTGYPTNIDQMRMLDLLATPPNRVIFIEVPAKECFIRLFYRKTDYSLGEEYKLPALESFAIEGINPVGVDLFARDYLIRHPRDDRQQIIYDIERYFEEKEEMMKYCGKTAAYVNGNKSVDSVFELIDEIIIKPSPAEPPRNPLFIGQCIEEAYERLQTMRMDSGITPNNLLLNPPNPIFKL